MSPEAHGFVRKRSIRTAAEPHVAKAALLHLDIEGFFPSLHFGRVRGLLVSYGYGYSVATALAVLMTESERQPVEIDGRLYQVPVGPRYCVQGAPTSPGLSNAICLRLDRRLKGLAKRFGCAYTRYADDITFSFAETDAERRQVKALRALATRILRDEGFRVNRSKTRVMRRGRRQSVTGVTVNEQLGLSRRERRRLRAMLHRLRGEVAAGGADPHRLAVARGKVAHLRMLNPKQAEALGGAPLWG